MSDTQHMQLPETVAFNEGVRASQELIIKLWNTDVDKTVIQPTLDQLSTLYKPEPIPAPLSNTISNQGGQINGNR